MVACGPVGGLLPRGGREQGLQPGAGCKVSPAHRWLSLGGASGASEAGPRSYEVLGSIIGFLAFNLDFLGFPYYCIRIS